MFQQTLNHTWKLMHAFSAKMEGRKYSRKQDFNENEIAEVGFFSENFNLKMKALKKAIHI